MNAWLVGQNDVLSGAIDYAVVPANWEHAKYLTDKDLDRYINDLDVDVHVDIISDDKGVAAVEIIWWYLASLYTIIYDWI